MRGLDVPVGFCGDQFCNGMCEGGIWADVEYGEGVLTVVHATSG